MNINFPRSIEENVHHFRCLPFDVSPSLSSFYSRLIVKGQIIGSHKKESTVITANAISQTTSR